MAPRTLCFRPPLRLRIQGRCQTPARCPLIFARSTTSTTRSTSTRWRRSLREPSPKRSGHDRIGTRRKRGALGTAAICTKQELLLVIIGGIFVMEAMSVILQVGSFKMRKKRIFKMSPIHHHFELLGWHESQVIIRFWILSIMLALFGLALLKIA